MEILLAFTAAMTIVTLLLYVLDKIKAKLNLRRIKEAVLLGFGFFGGAIGALIGMIIFRHKTKHWYFWIINILGLCLVFAAYLLISIL